MTKEEKQTLDEELSYWLDDSIEVRLDAEFARITRAYEETLLEESEWQAVCVAPERNQ